MRRAFPSRSSNSDPGNPPAQASSDSSWYVDTPAALDELCGQLRARLAGDARLAFDTEFIRERTYAPVLEIIQVTVVPEALIAIVDVPALRGDLGPLGDLLLDPDVLKIVHAGGQDVEILTTRLGGRMPAPIYDTQVAAAFAGFSAQTGYGGLVQSLLAVRLSKEEGFADWSRRPLSGAMLEYAENDVRYLHALHDRLSGILEKSGRVEWAAEQTERLLTGASEETPVDELFRRVGGRSVLDSRGLAVLRELAMWRDEEARRRDKPRRTVIKDEALIEIARRAPRTGAAILALRSVPPNLGERAADEIAARVLRGVAVPETDRPRPESAPPLDEQGAALVELFSAVVRIRAIEENLPPSLLANGDDLRSLAGARQKSDHLTGPLFTGWRGRLIGDALKSVLAGETAVSWDARRNRLCLVPAKADTPL